jgi:hypothetical protein
MSPEQAAAARYADAARVSPAIWPGKSLPVEPGDMSKFLPMGMGLSGGLPIRPWDDPLAMVQTFNDYYGVQPRAGHPFLDAPLTEARGGTVYLDGDIGETDFRTVVRAMGVQGQWKDYAVFLGEAGEPRTSRYVTQLRTMSTGALAEVFGAVSRDEGAALPGQPRSIPDLFWTFIERERERYPDVYPYGLQGSFGGDGDWAKESLCFGLMVENHPWSAYRIWTRAWLVTK